MSEASGDAVEVWKIHDEINLFLLEKIPDTGFSALTLLKNGQPSKGRNVARIFAHLHGPRTWAASFSRACRVSQAESSRLASNCWKRFARPVRLWDAAWRRRSKGRNASRTGQP